MSRRITDYESDGERWEDLADDGDGAEPAHRRRPPRLSVLLEGASWVVVDKPAGLATIRERVRHDAPTVVLELWKLWQKDDPDAAKPVVCHRLDKDTSGCLVLARDRATAKELMRQFRKHEVEKSYLALVIGAPQPPDGEVQFRVAPDRYRAGAMWTPRKGGKACHSVYETVETFRGVALVRVRPRTGRTHEVRLAMKTLGTPCAVDRLYGSEEPLLLSRWKRSYRSGRGEAERPLVDRLTLHAESLSFHDPDADPDDPAGRVTVTSPLPRDLKATVRQLQRHAAPGTL